jgi:hypothetical protein
MFPVLPVASPIWSTDVRGWMGSWIRLPVVNLIRSEFTVYRFRLR